MFIDIPLVSMTNDPTTLTHLKQDINHPSLEMYTTRKGKKKATLKNAFTDAKCKISRYFTKYWQSITYVRVKGNSPDAFKKYR